MCTDRYGCVRIGTDVYGCVRMRTDVYGVYSALKGQRRKIQIETGDELLFITAFFLKILHNKIIYKVHI